MARIESDTIECDYCGCNLKKDAAITVTVHAVETEVFKICEKCDKESFPEN